MCVYFRSGDEEFRVHESRNRTATGQKILLRARAPLHAHYYYTGTRTAAVAYYTRILLSALVCFRVELCSRESINTVLGDEMN